MNRRKRWSGIVLLGLVSIGTGVLDLRSEMGAGHGSAAGHEARLKSATPIVKDVGGQEAMAAGSLKVKNRLSDLQVPFIVNQGQIDERVKFYAKAFGGAA